MEGIWLLVAPFLSAKSLTYIALLSSQSMLNFIEERVRREILINYLIPAFSEVHEYIESFCTFAFKKYDLFGIYFICYGIISFSFFISYF